MNEIIPLIPNNSFRVILELNYSEKRLDSVLLKALRDQNENTLLKNISRSDFKEMFSKGLIMIKGQKATPSSSVAKGTTYVDILVGKITK